MTQSSGPFAALGLPGERRFRGIDRPRWLGAPSPPRPVSRAAESNPCKRVPVELHCFPFGRGLKRASGPE